VAEIPNLSENDWNELLKRLSLRASWKFYRLGWSTKENAGIGGGITPQSIALDTIISVLEGMRQYLTGVKCLPCGMPLLSHRGRNYFIGVGS